MSVDDRLREAFGETDRQLGRARCRGTVRADGAAPPRGRRTTGGCGRPGRRGGSRRRCHGRPARVRTASAARPRQPTPTPSVTRPLLPESNRSTGPGCPDADHPCRRTAGRTSGGRRRRRGGACWPACRRRRSAWCSSSTADRSEHATSCGRRTATRASTRRTSTCRATSWCSGPGSPTRRERAHVGASRTASCGWPSSRRPSPLTETACPPRPGSGCSTTPRPSRASVKAAERSGTVRAWAAPAGAARTRRRRRTPGRARCRRGAPASSSGTPAVPSSRPLNSTPVPSGSQAGSRA